MKAGRRRAGDTPRFRRVRRAAWAVALFFAVGYFPTVLLGSPVLPMAVAACLAIPYGSACKRAGQAAIRGALLGAVAGLAMAGALFGLLTGQYGRPATPPASRPATATQTRPATAPASKPATRRSPPPGRVDLPGITTTTVAGSVALCAAAAAMACHLGQRRRKRIEDEWHR